MWLEGAVSSIGNKPELAKLSLPKHLAAIKSASEKLEAFAKNVFDWEFEVDFAEQRSDYQKLTLAFNDACRQALRHQTAIAETLETVDKEQQAKKIFWRHQRTKIRNWLKEGGRCVPIAIGKVFSDLVYSTVVPLPR